MSLTEQYVDDCEDVMSVLRTQNGEEIRDVVDAFLDKWHDELFD